MINAIRLNHRTICLCVHWTHYAVYPSSSQLIRVCFRRF